MSVTVERVEHFHVFHLSGVLREYLFTKRLLTGHHKDHIVRHKLKRS